MVTILDDGIERNHPRPGPKLRKWSLQHWLLRCSPALVITWVAYSITYLSPWPRPAPPHYVTVWKPSWRCW